MAGWVRIHRSLLEWEWYQDSKMVHLFVHMLLKANHKPQKWRGIDIGKGQFVSGRKVLSLETGISEQSVRTCINKLKSTSELTIKNTNKYSLFTLNNWNLYQSEILPTNKLTSNQPATNQQLTTNKNVKNEKNDKNIERRTQIFFESLSDFHQYDGEMLNKFYEYWSEPNKSNTKMKFELQQTWDINRRLKTWASREKGFSKNSNLNEKGEYVTGW